MWVRSKGPNCLACTIRTDRGPGLLWIRGNDMLSGLVGRDLKWERGWRGEPGRGWWLLCLASTPLELSLRADCRSTGRVGRDNQELEAPSHHPIGTTVVLYFRGLG